MRKKLAIFLIFLLVWRCSEPAVVLADEPVETEQQEEGVEPPPEVETENEAEVENEVESTAISGENSIEAPSPTPSPLPEETPSPESTSAADLVPEESPSPSPSPTTIETGEAISVVEVENEVNSTEVNSQVLYQTLNIFASGEIDLTTTPLAIAEAVFGQESDDSVVNVSVVDNQNFTYLSNDIFSSAETGGNEIDDAQEALIMTGNACSVVSLLNKVNTTIADSIIHVVTINIFGNVKGNILLPEFSSQTEDGCCGEVIHTENTAKVENEVESTAISGQNSIVSTGSAVIKTGTAESVVNLVNVVNTQLIGVVFHRLFISTFGLWSGDFLGWDDLGAATDDNLSLSSINSVGNGDCPDCVAQLATTNEAQVVNNVSSTANTGGNTIEGDEGVIETGNAYSAVSIVNFVNSSIINSVGFLGFFNIFGSLEGDIGGASLLAAPPPEEEAPESQAETSSSDQPLVQEEGGKLEISQENNVGTHVLPGDTVTFFVTVKNPGTGRVFDTKLAINLLKDGVDMGGVSFDLGEIDPGKGIKISTGLVLSKNSEPGEYIARATVTGHVGPDNSLISASADSSFLIAGASFLPLVSGGVTPEVKAAEPGGEILAAATSSKGLIKEQTLRLVLLWSLLSYLVIKMIRAREKLLITFSQYQSFLASKSTRLRSIAAKLASFLS